MEGLGGTRGGDGETDVMKPGNHGGGTGRLFLAGLVVD